MVHTTIKHALKKSLQDLSKAKFDEFCHQLRDCREEPGVSCSDVEEKDVLQITDLLVSTFCQSKAAEVCEETLRLINCNQEADTLYSKLKAWLDKGDPVFRKTSTGELETKPSQEALNHAAGRWPLKAAGHKDPAVKKPEEVEAEAKAHVLSEGGDPNNKRVVLSRYVILFGQYKGQTFKWLLENDVGYAAYLVANHQMEQQDTTCQNPLMANKNSLTEYVIAYPEVSKEVRFHRAYEEAKIRSLQRGQEGKALVGFGPYRWETLQDLYKSKDENKIRYVNSLRTTRSTCEPGSKMDVAVKYIRQRDQKQVRAKTGFARGGVTGRKWGQSTRGQQTRASRPIQTRLRRSWRTSFLR